VLYGNGWFDCRTVLALLVAAYYYLLLLLLGSVSLLNHKEIFVMFSHFVFSLLDNINNIKGITVVTCSLTVLLINFSLLYLVIHCVI